MAIEITVPRLGWSMEEGTFVEWRKADGDRIRPGDVLYVLESEKAAEEVESLSRVDDLARHGRGRSDGERLDRAAARRSLVADLARQDVPVGAYGGDRGRPEARERAQTEEGERQDGKRATELPQCTLPLVERRAERREVSQTVTTGP